MNSKLEQNDKMFTKMKLQKIDLEEKNLDLE